MQLRPAEFIEPCLPTISRTVPTGPQWAYEIKHDGFRFICRRDGKRIELKGPPGVGFVNLKCDLDHTGI